MLDEFSATQIDRPTKLTQKPSNPSPSKHDEGTAARKFGEELQDQMAALMGNLDESPEMKWEIENMMKEIGAAADPRAFDEPTPQHAHASKPGAQSSQTEEPFQETIRKTMERMQASGDQAEAIAHEQAPTDILTQVLRDMQNSEIDGEPGEEGFNKMLLDMMTQLTNKEILYEPMKELHDKFPAWFDKNRESTKPDDMKRYEAQQALVQEIVSRFEQTEYSDSKPADREFIVDRMQQACNSDLFSHSHHADPRRCKASVVPRRTLLVI